MFHLELNNSKGNSRKNLHQIRYCVFITSILVFPTKQNDFPKLETNQTCCATRRNKKTYL